MTTISDRRTLLRLGADYLEAYVAGDAVTLYRLADRWPDTDLRDALCEAAVVGLRAALGPSGVDVVCRALREGPA